ncbi:MAG: polysaccharide lyase 6 family protein [Verrucomicrobiales bacterium]|nr:polysaccharide lyase 6 family protein [Verrucomicrobiales bacterium]
MRTLIGLVLCSIALTSDGATLVSDPESLRRAVRDAQPGDEILLSAGEWRDADLRLHGIGTEAAPIVIRAEQPGRTRLTGTSRLRLSGRFLTVRGLWFCDLAAPDSDLVEFRADSKTWAEHCRLTDCAITEDSSQISAQKTSRWINLYGTSNRVDHCRVEGKTNHGATLVVWLSDAWRGQHRIDHNHFGPRPALKGNGGETLRIGDSSTSLQRADCVIEENTFLRCNGETECISNKSCGNLYRSNLFTEVQGTLTLRHGNDCLVENNFFDGKNVPRTGGIRVIGEGHRILGNVLLGLAGDGFRSGLVLVNGIPDSPANGYLQPRNILVKGNTWIGCKHPWLLGYNDVKSATQAPDHIHFENNTLISSRDQPAIEVSLQLTHLTWKGNRISAPNPGIPLPPGLERIDLDATPPAAPRLETGPSWLPAP